MQDLPNIIPIKCLSKLAKNLTNLRREDVSVYRDNNYICRHVLYDQTKCGFCSEIYNCHSWEDWFQLVKWLRRKRLKCQNYRKRKPIDKRWWAKIKYKRKIKWHHTHTLCASWKVWTYCFITANIYSVFWNINIRIRGKRRFFPKRTKSIFQRHISRIVVLFTTTYAVSDYHH